MQEEYNDKPGDSRAEEQVPAPDQPVKANIGKRNFLNLHFLIDLIFLAGLVVLYILFFSSKKNSEPSFPNAFQKSSGAHSRVVFVNIDSLNNQYTFIIKLKTDLEATGKRYESEIQSQQGALEKEAADFQKQMDARAIPEDKAKLMYESLMQKQQALAEKKANNYKKLFNLAELEFFAGDLKLPEENEWKTNFKAQIQKRIEYIKALDDRNKLPEDALSSLYRIFAAL